MNILSFTMCRNDPLIDCQEPVGFAAWLPPAMQPDEYEHTVYQICTVTGYEQPLTPLVLKPFITLAISLARTLLYLTDLC